MLHLPLRRLTWFALWFVHGCTVSSTALAAAPAVLPLEYELLSAVLNHGLDPDAKQIVIADTTIGDSSGVVTAKTPLAVRAKELNVAPELLGEWRHVNQKSAQLAREFHVAKTYALMSEANRDLLFRGDNPRAGWDAFFARYPGSPGLLRVSRVAFDDRAQSALVYIEFQCGAECGSGRLVRATRDATNHWQPVSGELLWVLGPAASHKNPPPQKK
ncbi:MAG: hypothetical protein HYX63_21030 [Gammaproteobacteria bacterium]|nr:hypothetical protein [Gammaproteobacteria bacterium]